jgi:hypothetical protein
MRDLLKPLNGQRVEFTATLGRKGNCVTNGKCSNTRCLVDIKINDEIVTDHVWTFNEFFRGMVKGSNVSFTAIVTTYYKKVDGLMTKDYNISRIEDVKQVKGVYDYAMCDYRKVQM